MPWLNDLTSPTQGLLIPCLAAAQRWAIIRPLGASPKPKRLQDVVK